MTNEPPKCPMCRKATLPTSRYCPHCGALVAGGYETEDAVVLSGVKNLRVSSDVLNVRELIAVVEQGIFSWEQRFQEVEGIARDQAADAIRDLSRVLNSLSHQLEKGHETVRITSRLPAIRAYSVGCPVCGRGNRREARFCVGCGVPLPVPKKEEGHKRFSVRVASRSDVGQVRQNNEDTCSTARLVYAPQSSAIVLLVADGMGGAQAGEEASRLANETVQQELVQGAKKNHPSTDESWQKLLRVSAETANQRIYSGAQTHAEQQGMGTTLTVVVVVEGRAHMAHVGDSRAYLLNANGVTLDGARYMQLSTDHTLIARLVEIGYVTYEQARDLPQRNMLYRALGTDSVVEVDTMSQPLEVGDVLVLCSDGLTNYVEGEEVADIVLAASTPDQACDKLIALANQRGGRDNISVVVAKMERSQ